MERRGFLKLGMVMGGTIVLGGVHRFGRSLASAAETAIPTVDQLGMTVLPWAARCNKGGINVECLQPVRDLVRDEFPEADFLLGLLEFISIKPVVAMGSTALESYATHSRLPSPGHGHRPSGGGRCRGRCGSA